MYNLQANNSNVWLDNFVIFVIEFNKNTTKWYRNVFPK